VSGQTSRVAHVVALLDTLAIPNAPVKIEAYDDKVVVDIDLRNVVDPNYPSVTPLIIGGPDAGAWTRTHDRSQALRTFSLGLPPFECTIALTGREGQL